MKLIKVSNTPPVTSSRIEQMLSAITCDTRLELSLEALLLSQRALSESLDLTTELNDGHVPDINGIDEMIQTALDAIEEVIDESFTIKNRKRMMNNLISKIEKQKE